MTVTPSSSSVLAQRVLGQCAGLRIDDSPALTAAIFVIGNTGAFGLVLWAIVSSPWPGPILIALASLPLVAMSRWQWRIQWGAALYVEPGGVRIVEGTNEQAVGWNGIELASPFPNMLTVRFTASNGRRRTLMRYIRRDAPLRWDELGSGMRS